MTWYLSTSAVIGVPSFSCLSKAELAGARSVYSPPESVSFRFIESIAAQSLPKLS